MKVSYNWLKEHVELLLSPADLSERLLRLGFEVVAIERKGPDFSGVVTARVLEVSKHPNADRLSLCTVDNGREKFSVVCGAKNVAAGQIVALAVPGAVLPGAFKISRSKIRGVESNGMICASSELGLNGKSEGILVLGEETPLGEDFSKRFGPPEDILDIEITPNRPDCLSHRGLAREISVSLRLPLKKSAGVLGGAFDLPGPRVTVEESAACPRYVGRLIRDITVGPSPAWLARRLESVGLRSINNVVDVTNYVLFDIGQPMHAFDFDRLEGGEIRVRFARSGESALLLDEKTYALSGDILVIADAKGPCAVAGVMGGLDSAVGAKTKNIFLESAAFDGRLVRRASQKLKLRSDSSYRFERGIDPAGVDEASEKAARMIVELCGPSVKASKETVVGVKPAEPSVIRLTSRRVNEILGAGFSESEVEEALRTSSQSFVKEGEVMAVKPQSWRSDITTVWDLSEEVARMIGYERIPAKAGFSAAKPAEPSVAGLLAERARRRLCALGLWEALNYDFISEADLKLCLIDPQGSWARLENPVSEDWSVLRPTLLAGLLRNAVFNLNRGSSSVRLFELGKRFALDKGGVQERWTVSAVMLGASCEAFWKPARVGRLGFPEALGAALELLAGTGALPAAWKQGSFASEPLFNPKMSVRLMAGETELGRVGQLHPKAARNWGLEREEAAIFEIDLEVLSTRNTPRAPFKPYGLFPPVKRDLSIFVSEKTPYAAVYEAVRRAGGPRLVRLDLIDLFAGKNVPEGRHSLTLRLEFSEPSRTLTDAEAAQAMQGIVDQLQKEVGAELRK
jgi:phenylalanyl-tRNA synthetase beta chain